MKKIFILLAVISVAVLSCKPSAKPETQRTNGYSDVPKTKEDSLMLDIKNGHDIAMAKMSKITKLLGDIRIQLDSLAKVPKNKVDNGYLLALTKAQEELNSAENSMNTWMDKINFDSLENDIPKRIQYLEGEKSTVEAVKKRILESISKADSLLKK